MFEKDGIVYESVKEHKLEENASEQKKNPIVSSLIALLILIIIFFVLGAGVLFFILTYDTEYNFFTGKRTERMEEKFSITVTDDVKLEKYSEIELLTQYDYHLYLEVDDYKKFIKENINGEIILMRENGIEYNFEENTEETLSEDVSDDIFYKYKGEDNQIVYVDVYYSERTEKYNLSLNISL